MAGLSLRDDGGITTITFNRPILTRAVLSELGRLLTVLAGRDRPSPIVLASAHPTIFLAGAHLAEIAELDTRSCVPYARLGRSVAAALGSHPAPVVAAVAGSCSGGGFDLVMAADTVVASPNAVFSHPGIRRGLVTGWGGTESIGRTLGGATTRKALLEASSLGAPLLERLGAIRRLAADPAAEARRAAAEMARLDPRRVAVWRCLRGSNFVDRFRAFVVEKS
jgi:enoyl-CoA hydratase